MIHLKEYNNIAAQRKALTPTWVYSHCKCRSYLSDGHGAEDVEEDEGAVSVILAQQVAMRQSLDVRQRHKRQFGHYSSIKTEETGTDSGESLTAHFKRWSREFKSENVCCLQNIIITYLLLLSLEHNIPVHSVSSSSLQLSTF